MKYLFKINGLECVSKSVGEMRNKIAELNDRGLNVDENSIKIIKN